MKKSCQTNEECASLIISDLINENIDTFCLGSGSRSAPLAKALYNHPLAKTHLHYDERSLGFFALGVAKAKNAPVCLITTSGSAVANLFPAIMEAYMDNIPLLVITADRPFEENMRGMNQTCDQTNIFGGYVSCSSSLPEVPHNCREARISSFISYCTNALRSKRLPLHINIPFAYPQLSEETTTNNIHSLTKNLPTKTSLTNNSLEYIADIIDASEKILIVACGSYDSSAADQIINLSEKLKCPILADPLSSLREKGQKGTMITHYNSIIQSLKDSEALIPDTILIFGSHLVSKQLTLWLNSLNSAHQILITDKDRPIDLTLSINTRIEMNLSDFAADLNKHLLRKESSLYLALWKSHSLTAAACTEDFFLDSDKLYEPMAVTAINKLLEETPFPLFFGNSLPIRYADNFLFPKKLSQKIYGNRGVSGIDGNLSTALGLCKGLNSPLVTVLGDATFLYDVGALNLMAKENLPLIIVVINNNGGGIFNFLPYSKQKDLIDSKISPKTNLNIGAIATSFNIPYWKADIESDYTKMIDHLLSENTGGIIEIQSDKEENKEVHEELGDIINQALIKSLKKERFSYFLLPRKTKKSNPLVASTDS